MKSNTKQFPKNKIAWLWENMEGKRALYFVGILGTVLYNILQLTIPYFSGKIVDLFLTGENAATNLQVHRDLLYRLLFAMVGFTFLRVIVVYGSCMIYETGVEGGRRVFCTGCGIICTTSFSVRI